MSTDVRPADRQQFVALADRLRAREGYVEPVAFGIGMATVADADGVVLDTWYPVVNLEENLGAASVNIDAALAASIEALINASTVSGPRYAAETLAEIDTEEFPPARGA